MTVSSTIRVARKVVGPLETNCWILSCVDTNEAIIIDPGGDKELIEAFIKDTHLLPVAIVSTHGHSDHIAEAAYLKERYGVPFALHGEDIRILELSVREAPLWGFKRIKSPSVDRLLNAGDEIAFGNARGRILHTPGHTPGGVSILFDGFVIVGDTLFRRSIGRTDFEGGNLDTLISSIKRELLTLPDQTVVLTGHGPRTTIGEERLENPFL